MLLLSSYKNDGEAAFQLRVIENNTASENVSTDAISRCFAVLEGKIKNGDYFKMGKGTVTIIMFMKLKSYTIVYNTRKNHMISDKKYNFPLDF